MSTCSIIAFVDGKADWRKEWGNSWGGAAYIWNALFEKYLKNPAIEFDSWLSRCYGSDTSLWNLAERRDIPNYQRAVHYSTFDRAIIRREHFGRFAADLREFVREFPKETPKHVCHLLAWAELLDRMKDRPEVEAIGFVGTSCGENLWFHDDEERDRQIPYDLNTRDQHFEIYDRLDQRQGG